jgi:hypothetical protein
MDEIQIKVNKSHALHYSTLIFHRSLANMFIFRGDEAKPESAQKVKETPKEMYAQLCTLRPSVYFDSHNINRLSRSLACLRYT